MQLKENEKDIENSILQWLSYLRDGVFFKNHSTGIYDPERKAFRLSKNPYFIRGVSDILGVYKGVFCAFEVKTPAEYRHIMKHWERYRIGQITNKGQRRLANQVDFICRIREKGGIAGFVYSIEMVKELFRKRMVG